MKTIKVKFFLFALSFRASAKNFKSMLVRTGILLQNNLLSLSFRASAKNLESMLVRIGILLQNPLLALSFRVSAKNLESMLARTGILIQNPPVSRIVNRCFTMSAGRNVQHDNCRIIT